MIFKCWLTKENLVGPCKVKTCMWSSTNAAGCMASPEPPDMDTMTDAALARHKGMKIPELVNARMTAHRRIKSVLTISEYLDWCQGRPAPWSTGYNERSVCDMVGKLTESHWPYTVDDLGWRTRHIAFTLHKPSVDEFQAHVGKQIDWLGTIEFCMEEVQSLVKIFKSAARKSNGKNDSHIH